ncbi:sigma-54 dependent transcriptional regulator [Cytophagaceae bacterium DM2B3-1]|uniref:Sigma-54 dependent transcriptional regulator n=1 Tax=Xanthocytophaga flava TaxID=3048013 RepID=A0AAE3QPN0_9BACT|nr:sigma-54 dependent transcriptional regulator [Xanthocytophaga flavus]MDJ1468341.1 sigma-54 dependent transcriptional regulator [Xanthocytophaga flavus]MDJ1480413.1 sigma-54 dependent transcriptional regulator [Xanthocytophaga flavus]MDJ1493227.1 sigma-54 dependent transcriptional regulator [Xanthocytophaga flavus]
METKTGKILVVDDDTDVLSAARLFLKRHFLHVDVESNPESIPYLINNDRYDVILLDMNFTKDIGSGKEGFYWLDRILEIDPAAVVVLITAYGDVEMAVRAIKDGATDFVLKPWENEKLLATLISAMRLRQSREETATLKAKQKGLNQAQTSYTSDIIGQSPAMLRVYEAIDRVAETDANVLILGENGTGKELIARALHRKSKRTDEPFVSVDLGAISETLFESELFGHTKGSFTDAKEDRAGRFETASGGSIFLDEIGNLSLPLQAKLLTVLQSRTVTRVGSNKPKTIDVRLISATNMPVYDMVKSKTFRQDLLYRINTIEIHLPPLRERQEDLVPLAEYYLQLYRKKYNRSVNTLSPALLKRMQKYHWPGNVRELQHAIERAVIMAQGSALQPEDFFFSNGHEVPQDEESALDAMPLDEMEKMLIRKALKKHNGNITEAAQELGLTRSSLYRRLEKYGL